MKLPKLFLAAASALALQFSPAVADTITSATIKTHPSQGDVSPVAGAKAIMATGTNGLFVSYDTNGLVPGNAYTLLIAVMNEPGECPALPCTPKDVLKRSDIVLTDVGYAGGAIASATGEASFNHYQPVGALQKPFFANGLMKSEGVEVHLVLNDHGPIIEGREFEMLTTYRGGCSDESLPGPMPETARAQGAAGPNICRMVQNVQFIPDMPPS